MHKTFLLILAIASFYGCRPFRQDILFKTEEDVNVQKLRSELFLVEDNYRIHAGDRLEFRVFTNKGEVLLNPLDNNALNQVGGGAGNNAANIISSIYLVNNDGYINLPTIRNFKIEGLTLQEAIEQLQEVYSEYLKEPYVTLEFRNKRVVVLGATGGQIVPLENEKTSLIEVLAAAGGLDENSKGQNIRLIRGPLDNPEVFIIDLSTVEGMKASIVPLEPNDIVYVEPIRRKVLEQISYLSPIISILTSIIAIVIVATR